jgi:hypothetical protein
MRGWIGWLVIGLIVLWIAKNPSAASIYAHNIGSFLSSL